MTQLYGSKATLLAVGLCAITGSAQAQLNYPTRPIAIIHGNLAGGSADVAARLIADPLSSRLGKSVIVQPRPGAGGNLATAEVARATPDGYTLIMLTGANAVSPAIYKTLSFDPIHDFQMVSMLGYLTLVIAVRSDSPYKTLADLIAAAKAVPGTITFSSVGVGSTQHLAGELLSSMTGIKLIHVPYRGGTAPLSDLLGGQINVMIDSLTVADRYIVSGAIRGLALTSAKKWPTHGDIPRVAQTVPGYDVRTWLGIAAPKGVPVPIVARLNSDIRLALDVPEVRNGLHAIGMEIEPDSPEEMRKFVADEIVKWKKVASDANIPKQ